MLIRQYRAEDLSQIAELFYCTVHTVNAKDYTGRQLDAWADGKIDAEQWDTSLRAHHSLAAVLEERLVGFGDIDRTGYLERLYVHKEYQSQGIGTEICQGLEGFAKALALREIITHASITARPFFERRGYRVITEQLVERNGIFLKNFVMRLVLTKA